VKYLEAVASVVRDLGNDGSAEVARAGLRLALLAWRELGDTDAAWDRFGLKVLAAEELVRGLPVAAVACELPRRTDPDVCAAIAVLLAAVANHLDRTSQDGTRAVADRLACDAAAGQVRHALGVLP
jgi:hypothetical protein